MKTLKQLFLTGSSPNKIVIKKYARANIAAGILFIRKVPLAG